MRAFLAALIFCLIAPAQAHDFLSAAPSRRSIVTLTRDFFSAAPSRRSIVTLTRDFLSAAPSRRSIVTLTRDFLSAAPSRRSIVTLTRDDGRYANSPLKAWFDQLASGKGLCCSFADGMRIDDVDWDAQCTRIGGREETQHCRYRVRLAGAWIDVPPDALVTEPNRFGPAVVWPYQDADGSTQIRCFLPGAGA